LGSAAHNDVHIRRKGRVVYRVQTGSNPSDQSACYQIRSIMRSIGEGCDQICLVTFTANRCSIFAIQRHVKDADAKFLGHFCLQLQAFDHPRFHTTVVIADR